MKARQLYATLGTLTLVGAMAWFGNSLRLAQGEDLTKLLGVTQKLNEQVPGDVTLKDEFGETVALSNLYQTGKPTVLMLVFYTCNSSCILELEGALKAFKGIKSENIGRDYTVLTVSIHPEETPELARAKKAEYLDLYRREEAESGWRFLTGEYAQVKRLADSVGYRYTYDAEKNRVIHPTALIVLTPEGRVSKYLLGTEYVGSVLRDSLLAAKSNQIGTASVPILFGCFMYDPTTGATRLNVYNAIRLVGFLTLLTMGGGIFLMLRRERQQRNQTPTSGELNS